MTLETKFSELPSLWPPSYPIHMSKMVLLCIHQRVGCCFTWPWLFSSSSSFTLQFNHDHVRLGKQQIQHLSVSFVACWKEPNLCFCLFTSLYFSLIFIWSGFIFAPRGPQQIVSCQKIAGFCLRYLWHFQSRNEAGTLMSVQSGELMVFSPHASVSRGATKARPEKSLEAFLQVHNVIIIN